MEKQIVEINGIKMEVDLRPARRVEEFRVGDTVKILVKESYGEPTVYTGIIAGFEEFQTMPTIIVAYTKFDYSSAELKFAYINEKSKEKYELASCTDDKLPIDKADALKRFDRAIEQKQQEINDMLAKRDFFVTRFTQCFERNSEDAAA
jgi:hypothetical protein